MYKEKRVIGMCRYINANYKESSIWLFMNNSKRGQFSKMLERRVALTDNSGKSYILYPPHRRNIKKHTVLSLI